MICKPCQRAGDANQMAPITGDDDSLIRQLHDECEGDTRCDCQHRVGPTEKFINLKAE